MENGHLVDMGINKKPFRITGRAFLEESGADGARTHDPGRDRPVF